MKSWVKSVVTFLFAVMLIMAVSFVLAGPGAWQYHAGDLSGSGCLQEIVDDIADGTYTNTLVRATNITAEATVTGADLTATDDVTVGDDLAVTGLATVGETLGVTGVSTFTGGIVLPVASQTVTNGQVVTLAVGMNNLTASGEAALGTNIVTFAVVPQTGLYYVRNNSANSNLLDVAKSGNWKSAAFSLAVDEVIVVQAFATNSLHGTE